MTQPVAAPPPTASELRNLLVELTRRQAAAQERVRHWGNAAFAVCATLLVVLPLFAVIAPHVGGSLGHIRVAVSPGTNGAGTVATKKLTTGDLFAVELWGMLGGLISIIAALNQIRLTAVGVALPAAQLLLKPFAGAAVALFGVVIVQGELLDQFKPITDESVAAWAALFGFAQHVLTRLFDQRAQALGKVAARS